MNDLQACGKQLASRRIQINLSQKEAANQVDLPPATVSRIESGKFLGSLRIFNKYANFLDFKITLERNTQSSFPTFEDIHEALGDEFEVDE